MRMVDFIYIHNAVALNHYIEEKYFVDLENGALLYTSL